MAKRKFGNAEIRVWYVGTCEGSDYYRGRVTGGGRCVTFYNEKFAAGDPPDSPTTYDMVASSILSRLRYDWLMGMEVAPEISRNLSYPDIAQDRLRRIR